MPRKSKKDRAASEAEAFLFDGIEEQNQRTYRVALYVRLSIMEKRDHDENEALSNQKMLLREYIENRLEFQLYGIYEDNGETGTNFERPGFQRMMKDVSNGLVDCIIVKDLSRFARDHIEAGNYLENIFPFLKVRFISVLDHYDSAVTRAGGSWNIALRNLMNEVYAQDIGKKSSSAIRTKMRNGEYIGDCGPYGYRKDPDNKHKLIVDEEAAGVVRQLFSMAESGMRVSHIVTWLTDHEILSPGTYKHQRGLLRSKAFEEPKPWRSQTITDILSNQMYLGHMVQGRKRSYAQDGGPNHRAVPEEEWVIVKNTHKPLVTEEQFAAVQAILKERREQYHENIKNAPPPTENIFLNLVFCADCGSSLNRRRGKGWANNERRYFYRCAQVDEKKSKCSPKFVLEKELEEAVALGIWIEAEQAREIRESLARVRLEALTAADAKQYKLLKGAVQRTDTRLQNLMEDFLRGTGEHDLSKKENLVNEARKAEEALAAWVQTKNKRDKVLKKNTWLYKFGKYVEAPKLTRDTMEALIERIEVTGRNEIEIIFKFSDEKEQLLCLMEELEGERQDAAS